MHKQTKQRKGNLKETQLLKKKYRHRQTGRQTDSLNSTSLQKEMQLITENFQWHRTEVRFLIPWNSVIQFPDCGPGEVEGRLATTVKVKSSNNNNNKSHTQKLAN